MKMHPNIKMTSECVGVGTQVIMMDSHTYSLNTHKKVISSSLQGNCFSKLPSTVR